MNSIRQQGIFIVVILLLLIGVGTWAGKNKPKPVVQSSASTQSNVQSITYQGEDGKNVLELLKRDHKVETKDSPFGTLVASIDGISQSDTAVWLSYVDGEPSVEAPDQIITKNGQAIEWKYEKF